MNSARLAEVMTTESDTEASVTASLLANAQVEPGYASKDLSPDVVLLIDDDPAHRAALRALLEPRGFAVLTAAGGEEGLGGEGAGRGIKLHVGGRATGCQGQQGSQTKGAQRHGLSFRAGEWRASSRFPDQHPHAPHGRRQDMDDKRPELRSRSCWGSRIRKPSRKARQGHERHTP